MDDALGALLKRDRAVVATAMVVITLLAWAYILHLAAGMGAMPTGGMAMDGMSEAMGPAMRAWTPALAATMFAMWWVMMVGMMTPSVAPMILLYAAVGRKAAAGGAAFASAAWFLAGYLAVWTLFSAMATAAQWGLTQAALLTPAMAASSARLGGAVLIAAGAYQWTPAKETCLKACQAPISFLAAHGGFRGDAAGAARLGVRHGLYCLGCCFVLMALLFVGGVMNILWIAGLTVLVLLEKLVPAGRLASRLSGALMVAAGLWLFLPKV